MDGTRGSSLVRWVWVVAILLAPASTARASVIAPRASPAAYNAVFSTACPGADLMPDAATRTRARLATTCLLNKVREAAGLRPLTTVRALRHIAAEHSRDMVIRAYFSHTGPPETTLTDRLESVGFDGLGGENIGYGLAYYATPRAMMWGWMRSAGHRKNILFPLYRWVGTAISLGAPARRNVLGATYTMDFGGPEPK